VSAQRFNLCVRCRESFNRVLLRRDGATWVCRGRGPCTQRLAERQRAEAVQRALSESPVEELRRLIQEQISSHYASGGQLRFVVYRPIERITIEGVVESTKSSTTGGKK
jgi:hypothetical protein